MEEKLQIRQWFDYFHVIQIKLLELSIFLQILCEVDALFYVLYHNSQDVKLPDTTREIMPALDRGIKRHATRDKRDFQIVRAFINSMKYTVSAMDVITKQLEKLEKKAKKKKPVK